MASEVRRETGGLQGQKKFARFTRSAGRSSSLRGFRGHYVPRVGGVGQGTARPEEIIAEANIFLMPNMRNKFYEANHSLLIHAAGRIYATHNLGLHRRFPLNCET